MSFAQAIFIGGGLVYALIAYSFDILFRRLAKQDAYRETLQGVSESVQNVSMIILAIFWPIPFMYICIQFLIKGEKK